jgi:hypothetical protein
VQHRLLLLEGLQQELLVLLLRRVGVLQLVMTYYRLLNLMLRLGLGWPELGLRLRLRLRLQLRLELRLGLRLGLGLGLWR